MSSSRWGHFVGAALGIVTAIMVGRGTAFPAGHQSAPAGFRSLEEVTWDTPWVWGGPEPTRRPLPALDNSRGQLTNGPVPIRLDDGRTGALRVESLPCGPSDDCAPLDCGCPLERDSYWIIVTDADGRSVARLHLWAAYGRFQIVPIDLVDGIADELLIVRVPAHASPLVGYDLKIWKIAAKTPIILGGRDRIANLFSGRPIGCARWRTDLVIDTTEPKPRSIALRSDFGASPGCALDPDQNASINDMRRDRLLYFDSARRLYLSR